MFVSAIALFLAQPAAATAPDDTPAEELVCKRVRQEARRTGSNMRRPSRSKKVCRTATEWAQIEQAKEEMFREVNENGGAGAEQGAGFGG